MSRILVCSRCLTDKWVIQRRDDGSQVKQCAAWWGACRIGRIRPAHMIEDDRPYARGRWMDFDEWQKVYYETYPINVEGPC